MSPVVSLRGWRPSPRFDAPLVVASDLKHKGARRVCVNHGEIMEDSSSLLDRARSAVNHWEERKARASARLSQNPSKGWWYALLGFKPEADGFEIGPLAAIRPVVEPPGEVELASALKAPGLFGAIGRYSSGITYELFVNAKEVANEHGLHNLAWWIISAIRVKSLAEFLVPAAADHSWSTISGAGAGKVDARLIEDVPRARRTTEEVMVSRSVLEWTLDKLPVFIDLLEQPRFRLAVDALTTHQHLVSPRVMAASLWSGIEAIGDVKMELRFRLSLIAACLTTKRGPERVERYRTTKKLYDVRSKAVHGAAIEPKDLLSHVVETRRLLSDLICSVVARGHLPDEEELEEEILGQ